MRLLIDNITKNKKVDKLINLMCSPNEEIILFGETLKNRYTSIIIITSITLFVTSLILCTFAFFYKKLIKQKNREELINFINLV